MLELARVVWVVLEDGAGSVDVVGDGKGSGGCWRMVQVVWVVFEMARVVWWCWRWQG